MCRQNKKEGELPVDQIRLHRLVRRAKRGDGSAMAEALALLEPQLMRAALCLLRNEERALEALSETACRAFEALHTLRQDRYFATWTTKILLNVCKDELRRSGRLCPLETWEEPAVEEDTQGALELRAAVEQLPDELRELVVLRFFCDRTVAEAARLLDIPEGTAKTRLRRALQFLRAELEVEE